MRVISGSARRLELISPKGLNVRPTTDRTKETLFNIINTNIHGSVFLDLFSGSGAIGIEALSRGAKEAYFIENDKESIACITHNLKHTKLIEKSHIMKYDYDMGLLELGKKSIKFDIIFMDPPYNNGYEEKAIEKILEYELIDSNSIIICESATDTDFRFVNNFANLDIIKEKKYKTSKFSFLQMT